MWDDAAVGLHSDSRSALDLAVAQGMIGGDLTAHISHANGFAAAFAVVEPTGEPGKVVDLGSGGGLPAFVLIEAWPSARFLLVEGRSKRAELLDRGSRLMGVTDRVQVHTGDAQEAMIDPEWHGQADVATARSFASPPIAAECAAHFLKTGGWAIISEPPDDGLRADRWPSSLLEPLGLVAQPIATAHHRYIGLHKTGQTAVAPRKRKPMEKSPLA